MEFCSLLFRKLVKIHVHVGRQLVKEREMMRREMHVEKEEVKVGGTGVGGRIESWRGTEGGGGVYKCAILHTYGSHDGHVCRWVFHNTTPLIQTPSTTLEPYI